MYEHPFQSAVEPCTRSLSPRRCDLRAELHAPQLSRVRVRSRRAAIDTALLYWVDPASRAFSLIRSIGLSPRASQLDDLVVISPFCRLSYHVDLTSSPPNRPVPPGQGVPRQPGPSEVAWLIRRPCEGENEVPRRHEELVTDTAHSSWVLLSKRATPKSMPF